jgi:hypothetical protein
MQFCYPSQSRTYTNTAAKLIDENMDATNQFRKWICNPPTPTSIVSSFHLYEYWLGQPTNQLKTLLKRMRPTVRTSIQQASDVGRNLCAIDSYSPVDAAPYHCRDSRPALHSTERGNFEQFVHPVKVTLGPKRFGASVGCRLGGI